MTHAWCGWRVLAGSAALALGLAAALPGTAAEAVDIELILAVDVSLSMSPTELEIQRDGYAAALTHDRVLQAIAEGYHGRIAVTYFEWAGTTSHHVVVPWTVVATRDDAEKVAGLLSAKPPSSARRTSVSAALGFGNDLFAESPFRGMKARHRHLGRRAQQPGTARRAGPRRTRRPGHHHQRPAADDQWRLHQCL